MLRPIRPSCAIPMAVVACVLAPNSLVAQTCGDEDPGGLDFYGALFFSDEQEDFRSGFGISRLPPGTSTSVVTDPQTCQRILGVVEQWLDGSGAAENIDGYGWTYDIYQYGVYFAMPFLISDPEHTATSFPPGPDESFVFRWAVIPILVANGDQFEIVATGLW